MEFVSRILKASLIILSNNLSYPTLSTRWGQTTTIIIISKQGPAGQITLLQMLQMREIRVDKVSELVQLVQKPLNIYIIECSKQNVFINIEISSSGCLARSNRQLPQELQVPNRCQQTAQIDVQGVMFARK